MMVLGFFEDQVVPSPHLCDLGEENELETFAQNHQNQRWKHWAPNRAGFMRDQVSSPIAKWTTKRFHISLWIHTPRAKVAQTSNQISTPSIWHIKLSLNRQSIHRSPAKQHMAIFRGNLDGSVCPLLLLHSTSNLKKQYGSSQTFNYEVPRQQWKKNHWPTAQKKKISGSFPSS